MNPANDNHTSENNLQERPADFDDRIMAYRPGLESLARKYRRDPEQRADLVTDTIIYCLEHWQNFREEGGLWKWLAWQMRGIVSNEADRKYIKVVDADRQMEMASTQPTQHDYAELSAILGQLSGRGGHVVLRQAMGDTLTEIGAEMGVSCERARQLAANERARLAKRKLMVA